VVETGFHAGLHVGEERRQRGQAIGIATRRRLVAHMAHVGEVDRVELGADRQQPGLEVR
jgi:hypothetical protein